jgi:hypothetical protein
MAKPPKLQRLLLHDHLQETGGQRDDQSAIGSRSRYLKRVMSKLAVCPLLAQSRQFQNLIVMMIAITPSLKATIRATVPDLERLSAILGDFILADPPCVRSGPFLAPQFCTVQDTP